MTPLEVHRAQLFTRVIGKHLRQMASFEEEQGQGGKPDHLGIAVLHVAFSLMERIQGEACGRVERI